jgi:predicted RNA polymerase sigma factor
VKGRVLTRLGRTREAIDAFERSLAIQASPKNGAWRELAALGVQSP